MTRMAEPKTQAPTTAERSPGDRPPPAPDAAIETCPTRIVAWRSLEMIALFGLLPWLYSGMLVRSWGIWPPIFIGFAGCLAYLLLDRGFDNRRLWNLAGLRIGLRWMLIRFGIAAALLTLATWLFERDLFFGFPLSNTGMWVAVMLLYPILSVYPQEVIFRTFFVRRYEPALMRIGGRYGVIIACALAFGWAHVIFGTVLAVALSAIGGVLFTTTYLRTRSTAAACLEHALYGDLLFTVGLGWYFYSGSIGASAGG